MTVAPLQHHRVAQVTNRVRSLDRADSDPDDISNVRTFASSQSESVVNSAPLVQLCIDQQSIVIELRIVLNLIVRIERHQHHHHHQ